MLDFRSRPIKRSIELDRKILLSIKNVAETSMCKWVEKKKAATQSNDILASVDDTWHKRGFSSRFLDLKNLGCYGFRKNYHRIKKKMKD